MGSDICLQKDYITVAIYQEGGFLQLLAHCTYYPAHRDPSPVASEIGQLKAPGTVCYGGLAHMYECVLAIKESLPPCRSPLLGPFPGE